MSDSANGSGVYACANGPRGDECPSQMPGKPGHSSPNRTKKMNPSGGYHVTSPAAVPSKVKELASRP